VLERLHGGLGQSLSARQWPGYSQAFTRAVDAAMGIRPQERPQSISDWLKLFEARSGAEDATRIGTPIPADPTVPAMTARPVAIRSPAIVSIPPKQSKQQGGRFKPAVIGSLAAILLISIAGFLLWPRPKTAPGPLPASAFASTTPSVKPESLDKALDSVIAAAQTASRPQSEIGALTDAKAKLLALEQQKTPGAADQLNDAARDAAKTEIAALGRSSRRLWRDLGTTPDSKSIPDPTNAINQIKTAKADLDGKVAADLTTLDAAAATVALQQTLESYAAFQQAYGAASPLFITARKKELSDLQAAVQATADQLVAMAGVAKPWFLASQARKQAYQIRQDNAAQAKALLTQLNSAASVAQSAKDLKMVNAAIAQLTAGQTTLSSLHAASDAAKL
jgi:non-specific serine/threonine protein kinase